MFQYWAEYTTSNVAAGIAPKPPPPIKGEYTMFGVKYNVDDVIIRPLESQVYIKFEISIFLY